MSTEAKGPLLLCIDDAEIALRIRKLIFEQEGYRVATEITADSGLRFFREHDVDMVIADHFLQGITGTEVAREMKRLKPRVPILIVSAAAEELEGLEFADGFFPKAGATEELIKTVAAVLQRTKLQSQV
jgi:DNA-binding response OmpR family regulator